MVQGVGSSRALSVTSLSEKQGFKEVRVVSTNNLGCDIKSTQTLFNSGDGTGWCEFAFSPPGHPLCVKIHPGEHEGEGQVEVSYRVCDLRTSQKVEYGVSSLLRVLRRGTRKY